MSEYQTVGKLSNFPPGEISAVFLNAREVAIANVEGRIYAFDNCCTHEAVPFTSECGLLTATSVVCLLHGSTFDLTTGNVTGGPAPEPVKIYKVRITGDDVEVATGVS
jgi:3-phenylpropionate/trans-cinnamate dioxygenase ferredoxin subunit